MTHEIISLTKIKKLAIIAGAGYLPKHVCEACKEQRIPYVVIGLENETTFELFKDEKIHSFKIYNISKIIEFMKSEEVNYITFAGKVRRAHISRLLLDFKGAILFAKVIRNGLNDSAILKTVLDFIEKEGFKIIAPEKVAHNIILTKGLITKSKPDQIAEKDIKQGIKILRGIASFDVGQALVIQNGLVLGVEAAEGTDDLIKRCGEIRQEGEGPILIKIIKPEQDKRVDMPCIGPETIMNAQKFGIRGIAAESGSTLVLDQVSTVKLANRFGIFIYGF
jgi:DUF1009 family protein